ncbi:MAG: S1C family serine protease [Treponema sp.]|nr:S1C family serine protease [Treponema sp.]
MLKNHIIKSILLFLCVLLCSCKSVKQPDSIAQQLDYTDKDIAENEKNNILEIKEKEPVKALYRSIFLGDEEIISLCKENVRNLLLKAIEDKDYLLVTRYENSLKTLGMLPENYESYFTEETKEEIPGGRVDREKLPLTINDCVNATATIIIDRGLKVENGAGYVDVVIGSGFFIDKRGYLITNHHVIESMVNPKDEGFSRLYIKLPADENTKIPAKVIGYDPVIDLALLKVEIEPEFVFELGSSEELSIGDKVIAIGAPLGLEGTITSGIISNVNRKLFTMGNVFQLDAAVNSGNSGGPLIDSNRKVQAIIFAGMLQYQGLNFAIPVEYLKQELPLLYAGGKVNHAWISAYGHTRRIKNSKEGLDVQYVLPGGSAAFSGIKVDDVIIELAGEKVNSIEDIQFICMKYAPGTILNCKYKVNDEEEKSVIVYLEKRGDSPLVKIYNSDFISDSFIPIFGMKLVRSSTTNRKSYRIEKVITGSSADESGFSENDPIEVLDVKLDHENKILAAQIYVKRKKKGFLDAMMILYAPFDSPYYF